MKKIIIVILIILGLVGLYVITSKKPDFVDQVVSNPDVNLYWGEGCSHCKIVEDYINSNKINDKIKIQQKEVYNNQKNAAELNSTVNTYCKELNQGGVGIPLMFDLKTNKCIQGDQPIIDYLSQKTGQNNK